MINKELISRLKNKDFFSIAKIIDNEYIGGEEYFSSSRTLDYYFLCSDKCDSASMIRVYDNGIIKRLGSDTEGYEEIQPPTYKRVCEWILKEERETNED